MTTCATFCKYYGTISCFIIEINKRVIFPGNRHICLSMLFKICFNKHVDK